MSFASECWTTEPDGQSGSSVRNLFVLGIPSYDSVIWQALSARGFAIFIPDFDTRVGTTMRDTATNVLPAIDKIVALDAELHCREESAFDHD